MMLYIFISTGCNSSIPTSAPSTQQSISGLNNSSDIIVKYEGISMKLRANIKKEDFELSDSLIQLKLKSKSPDLFINNSMLESNGISAFSTKGELIPILTLDTLASIFKGIEANYPSMIIKNKEDLDKVKADFPTMSDEDIAKNIEKIKNCYSQQKKIEFTYNVINFSKTESFKAYKAKVLSSLKTKTFSTGKNQIY